MYDTVIYPTDGSEGAKAAQSNAVDLADTHDATLDVLFAEGNGDGDPETVMAPAVEAAEAAGVPVNTAALDGAPEEVIVEYVGDRGADVVVMGTHGRRGIERYVVGSVTEKVLRSVDVPVLVVPLAASRSG